MKEKILDAFKALGFKLEDLDGTALGFHYEGRSFLLLPNEEDEEFLNIALPCVLEKDEVDEDTFIEAMERLNATLKYVKTYKEDLKGVIRRMIMHLEAGHFFLHHRLLSTNDDDGGNTGNPDVTEIIENNDEEVA